MNRPIRNRPIAALAAFLITAAALALGGAPAAGNEEVVQLPTGIPREVWAYYIPKENPITRDKIELGRRLFFDPRLSADGKISCSACHEPERAFTDGRAVSIGIGGRQGTRNAPTLLNAMFNSGQFWDGRAATLEAQAIEPLINPDEMGNASHAEVVARLQAIPEYAGEFQRIFGEAVTMENVGRAIASFERTLLSGNSPFDRFQAGDREAMSSAAQRGFLIFRTRGRCTVCHTFSPTFPFFTDQNYRNTGVAARDGSFLQLVTQALDIVREARYTSEVARLRADRRAGRLGRFLFTGNSLDIGAFRTPSLRDIELTAPYFHDGSAGTLRDVINFYMRGGIENPGRDWQLEALDLSEEEIADLLEFLRALTSDRR